MRGLVLIVASTLAAQTGITGGSAAGEFFPAPRPHIGETWTNRNPIGMVFVSVNSQDSADNQRGYGPGGYEPPTPFTQEEFTANRLDFADAIIAQLDAMTPKPQGALIWDLEGAEFHPGAGYLGHPSLLPLISPEMDAAADAFFQRFKDAGYAVGVTVRPQRLQAGTVLPGSCDSEAEAYSGKKEAFILYTAPYGERFYNCDAKDVWVRDETVPFKDQGRQQGQRLTQAIEQVRLEILYAYNRWGATLFYIDSNVNTAGGGLSATFVKTLRQQLPEDVLLIPEHEQDAYYYYSAPYDEVGATPQTPAGVRDNSAHAFSCIRINTTDYTGLEAEVAAGVAAGDVLLFQWFSPAERAIVEEAYEGSE
jgi:hypothetical protein